MPSAGVLRWGNRHAVKKVIEWLARECTLTSTVNVHRHVFERIK